jgi:hypothetical protein
MVSFKHPRIAYITSADRSRSLLLYLNGFTYVQRLKYLLEEAANHYV